MVQSNLYVRVRFGRIFLKICSFWMDQGEHSLGQHHLFHFFLQISKPSF